METRFLPLCGQGERRTRRSGAVRAASLFLRIYSLCFLLAHSFSLSAAARGRLCPPARHQRAPRSVCCCADVIAAQNRLASGLVGALRGVEPRARARGVPFLLFARPATQHPLLSPISPGANDVANAFATSVGAKTLKMWHAVVLAIIFEFTGAIVLGRVVTGVIAGGIANIKDFQGAPEVVSEH